MAYDSIDPIGNDRLDMHAGIVASTIANSVGGKINGKSFAPSDFMPFIDKPKPNPVAIFKAQMAHMVNRK